MLTGSSDPFRGGGARRHGLYTAGVDTTERASIVQATILRLCQSDRQSSRLRSRYGLGTSIVETGAGRVGERSESNSLTGHVPGRRAREESSGDGEARLGHVGHGEGNIATSRTA